LPSGIPAPGVNPTFAEIVDVNYSTSLTNQTIVIQYLRGTQWTYFSNFTANSVGFTETTLGLNSYWASLGTNTIRATTNSCAANPVTFSIAIDPSAVPTDLAVYALLALFGASIFLLGRKASYGVFMVVAAAIYLVISPYTGQRYDVFFLLSPGIRILQHVSPFDPGNPPLYPPALKWAYPPLYTLYSAASFSIYQLLTGAHLPSVSSLTWPGWLTSTYNVWLAYVPKSLPVLVFLLKLPMVASALATGVLLKKMTGSRSAAVSWVANPLVIFVAAVWGQLDPIATLLAVGAVYYFYRNKPYHAYLLASFGAAVKVWPVLLIPLFFVMSLKKEGRSAAKPLSAVVPALAVTVGLYAAYGNLLTTLFVFLYARGVPTYAGEFSVNGLTWQQVLFVLGSPPVPLFLLLGIPIYAIILAWVYKKGDADVEKWIVVSVLVFYLTYNYVNPQYFYWILPFLILQRKRLATALFTALPLIYVALSYNLFYFVSPSILLDEFSNGASIVEQLKLVFFYTTPVQYILVSAAVPTAAYLLLLRQELFKGKKVVAQGKAEEPGVTEKRIKDL
jgi:hypothetical protein